jgi:hypothetical protein
VVEGFAGDLESGGGAGGVPHAAGAGDECKGGPEAMQIEVAKKILYWVYSIPRSYSISRLPTLSLDFLTCCYGVIKDCIWLFFMLVELILININLDGGSI